MEDLLELKVLVEINHPSWLPPRLTALLHYPQIQGTVVYDRGVRSCLPSLPPHKKARGKKLFHCLLDVTALFRTHSVVDFYTHTHIYTNSKNFTLRCKQHFDTEGHWGGVALWACLGVGVHHTRYLPCWGVTFGLTCPLPTRQEVTSDCGLP